MNDPLRDEDEGSSWEPLVAGLSAYAWWGLVPLYWKLLGAADELEVLAHRVVWSYAIMLPTLLRKISRGDERRHHHTYLLLALSSACLAFNWGLFAWAVGGGRIVETSFGYFVTPLATVLLGRFVLRERLSTTQWIGVVGATGAMLVMAAGQASPPWIALGLASSFAVYGVVRKIANVGAVAAFTVEIGILAVPAAAYLSYIVVTGALVPTADAVPIHYLAGLGLISTVPILLFGSALRGMALSRLALIQYLAPSVQFVLGITAFNQVVAPSTYVAFGMLWAALAIGGAVPLVRRAASRRTTIARWN